MASAYSTSSSRPQSPALSHQVSPYLLLDPVLHVTETSARLSYAEVVRPSAQDWVDESNDPFNRLRAMSSHHPLEPSQEFGACRYLRHTGNPPLAPLRPGAADAEPKEGETLALCEIDATRLVTIEFHVECGQFLQKSLVHGRLKPPPPAVAVDQDHQVSRPGESHPRALAELYVNVSAHTAPIIQPPASAPADASGRTAGARDAQDHRASEWRGGDGAGASCISAWPIEPTGR